MESLKRFLAQAGVAQGASSGTGMGGTEHAAEVHSFFASWHFRMLFFYVFLWSMAEVVAAKRSKNVKKSCKHVSLLHCIVAFTLSSLWLLYHVLIKRFLAEPEDLGTMKYELPGTFEHHILQISMAYFIVDMPFAIAFHQTFIIHHLLCIFAFGAIQGYLKYWPFNFNIMHFDKAPKLAPSHLSQYMMNYWGQDPNEEDRQMQLLIGGFNGIFNLWMAELGGLFFHINRLLQGTDYELPSRGLFVVMFSITRCYMWPMYLKELYHEAGNTSVHMLGAFLETGLFLTNLHFLWKNLKPIFQTGRLMPKKPTGFHRRWLSKHPSIQKAASLIFPKKSLELSDSMRDELADEPEGSDEIQKKNA